MNSQPLQSQLVNISLELSSYAKVSSGRVRTVQLEVMTDGRCRKTAHVCCEIVG